MKIQHDKLLMSLIVINLFKYLLLFRLGQML